MMGLAYMQPMTLFDTFEVSFQASLTLSTDGVIRRVNRDSVLRR